MEQALDHLDQVCSSEFKHDPLYEWIRTANTVEPRRQLDVAVCLLNFIILFPYYNKLYVTSGDASEDSMTLSQVLAEHAFEDANHVHYFLKDFKNLSLDSVWGLHEPSDLLWVMWSSPTLEKTRYIYSQRVSYLVATEYDDLRMKFLQVEQIELDGYYLFSAFNEASKNIKQHLNLDSIYFGEHHLARESGHVGANEFKRYDFTLDELATAKNLVATKQKLSSEMNQFMHSFCLSMADKPKAGDLFRSEKNKAIKKVTEKLKLYRSDDFPDLNWSISPSPEHKNKALYNAWTTHHDAFIDHPLFNSLTNTTDERCLQTLRSTMLFFANRSLSLHGFNLHDLDGDFNNASFKAFEKIRKMFASHDALFFHDWDALHMDDALKTKGADFLKTAFLDEQFAESEMIALHEFKREALRTAKCPVTKIWCYLSINFMASAFTKATRKLTAQYESLFPDNKPLAYMSGKLHLLYDEAIENFNDQNIIDALFSHTVDKKQEEIILAMMDKFHQFGIKQWDALYNFLQDDSQAIDVFEQGNSYLSDKLKLPNVIDKMLFEEQVLHAKNLEFPWPEDNSVFAGELSSYYYPESRPLFPLPYYLVPKEQSEYFIFENTNTHLEENLRVEIDGQVFYRLFIHPSALDHYTTLLQTGCRFIDATETEYLATPTSSYRSLMTWNKFQSDDPNQFFIAKVSIDKIIFAENRLVTKNAILRSQVLEGFFRMIGDEQLAEKGFILFPEVASLIPKSIVANVGGQIIRQIPQTVLDGKRRFIPLQSLISPEKTSEPLILKVIQNSGLTSKAFIKKIFIDTYLQTLTHLSFERGIGFHAHLQNLLLETTDDLTPTGNLVHRDHSDMPLDITVMIANDVPFNKIPQFTQIDFQSTFYGFHVYAHVYMYKVLTFDTLLRQLMLHDPSLSQADVDELSDELDDRFLDLIKRHTQQSVTMSELVQGDNYDQKRMHYEFIGKMIMSKAFQGTEKGRQVTLSPLLIATISNAVKDKTWWHFDKYDLAYMPDDVPPEFYLSFYQYYEYENILYAKNDKGNFVGFMFYQIPKANLSKTTNKYGATIFNKKSKENLKQIN